MTRDQLTVWQAREIATEFEDNQLLQEEMYEKEEVDSFLSEVENMIYDAINEIDGISGISEIEECKEILQKVISMIY